MQKLMILPVFGLMIILALGAVSATPCVGPSCENTVVSGTIYQGDVTNGISDAEVTVSCNGYDETTTSLSDGQYSVTFSASECDYQDDVTVIAEKDELVGTNEGDVSMTYTFGYGCKLNVGVINVPLVPEFGLIAGALTMVSAVGIFFIVRRH